MSRYIPPRKKRKANNFKFALGIGVNWVDIDKQRIYMIQEYYEKMNDPTIPPDKKPTKIRVMAMDGKTQLDYVEPEIVEERMKDPEPDKRYSPETPEEFRRSMK